MESYKNQFYPTAYVVRIGQSPGLAKYIVNVAYQTDYISDKQEQRITFTVAPNPDFPTPVQCTSQKTPRK